jgi:hypothetical protein
LRDFVYRILKNNRLTRNTVSIIEERMSLIYPGDFESVTRVTMSKFIKITSINILLFIVIVLLGKKDIVYFIMAMMVINMTTKKYLYHQFDHLDIKLLKQFQMFIQDIRFKFKYNGMIEEAINEAIEECGQEMRLQGYKMLESLQNVYYGDEANYVDIAPNSFFMRFYTLCETIIKYGDKDVDGKSIFITNLSYLNDDVNGEILKREKIQSLFMGLSGVVLLPILAIKPITIWGTHNISGLKAYYDGNIGRLSFILITISAMLIMNIIIKLEYPMEYDVHKSKWVDEILRINCVDNFLIKRISKNYKKYYELDRFLKSLVYKYNVKELMIHREVAGIITFLISNCILWVMGINSDGFIGMVSGIMIAITTAIMAYEYEMIMLFVRQKLLRVSREEEIVRMQCVIIILMNIEGISVQEIVSWLEKYTVVFKNTLERITDTLSYKGIMIFEKAKEEVKFLPFSRMMDCFIASDRIGIQSAFSDIVSDRLYYSEKHKQDNEIIINNKAIIGKFIAFIPICTVIIFVLILPFVYEGLKQLRTFSLV